MEPGYRYSCSCSASPSPYDKELDRRASATLVGPEQDVYKERELESRSEVGAEI